ncbi:sialate O-acetylesterase [Bacteroidota bacterium]
MKRIRKIAGIIVLLFLCVNILNAQKKVMKKKKLQVFILLGQSNMMGTADVKTFQYLLQEPYKPDLEEVSDALESPLYYSKIFSTYGRELTYSMRHDPEYFNLHPRELTSLARKTIIETLPKDQEPKKIDLYNDMISRLEGRLPFREPLITRFIKDTKESDFLKLPSIMERLKESKRIRKNPQLLRLAYANAVKKAINLPIAKHTYISAYGAVQVPENQNKNMLNEASGPLSIGYGVRYTTIGPEYGFGIAIEEKLDANILIIKCSWGGTALASAWRPPSAPPYIESDEEKMIREARNTALKTKAKAEGTEFKPIEAKYFPSPGICWTEYHFDEHIKKILANPGKYHPGYDENIGYEIAGLVWFQGHNDLYDGKEYKETMRYFIHDIRRIFETPNMPVVMGTVSTEIFKERIKLSELVKSQIAVAEFSEFKGNVTTINTLPFYPTELTILDDIMRKARKDDPDYKTSEKYTRWNKYKGISNAGYHYMGSAEFFTMLSDAFANAMVKMMENKEYHVSTIGLDTNPGSKSKPFKTISAAAQIAQPGDVITVHEGIYRERVNPPRGGTSEDNRIVYQAAEGEKVIIKGSETVKGWEHIRGDIWKVTLPNSFFGEFNPFKDTISGDWFWREGRVHHPGTVYLNGNWFREALKKEDLLSPPGKNPLWFAEVDKAETTIWAQFKSADPNIENVEVNVRQTVFYPTEPGVDYITVRGFTMEQAATPWAPPTAEQVGLIGTHWSKGWIIENNTIRYSACTGITLGKYGDEWDNRAESAYGYNQTIRRALENGWARENIGHHQVQNNHILHCGQSGIVGSMGAVFSTITGNEIHDIHLDWPFTGAEMAGIKLHGSIDVVISNNHIYRCGIHGGIWLDWMTQGTRVTGNLLHDNKQDLFVEVNHGPFLIDNNLFLSPGGLLEASGGGAYVHNLFACQIRLRAELTRETPFHKPHSTEVLGLAKVIGDDERFYNNIFLGHNGLSVYGEEALNLQAVGNLYLAGSKPSKHDLEALDIANFDPKTRLEKKADGWWLEISIDPAWTSEKKRHVVTTESLGRAKIPDAQYEKRDGKPYKITTDYFGMKRNSKNPAPGPFHIGNKKNIIFKVWPGN